MRFSPKTLTLGRVTSSYADQAADRGMLILIWQLGPSQSFLAHSAMRRTGVCMVISCAHLNRILEAGMLSLRQHYAINIPEWWTFDNGKDTTRTWKTSTNWNCTFPPYFSKSEGLDPLQVYTIAPEKGSTVRYLESGTICVIFAFVWHSIQIKMWRRFHGQVGPVSSSFHDKFSR